MSSDESPNLPAERGRRHAVREKAQQVRAQQSRAHAIRTTSVVTGIVALIAVAAVIVVWAVTSAASQPLLSPTNVTGDGFVVTTATGVGSADESGAVDESAAQSLEAVPLDAATAAPVETPSPTPTPISTPTEQPVVDIRVYVDYLSEGSHDFQVANVQQLSEWVSGDAATLTYYPVAMLTAKSNGTKYSLRAASAAACVATHSPDTFFAYNNALLDKQPAVDSDGYSDAELADIAQARGVDDPKVVRSCIEKQSFASWAKSATERALQGLPDTKDAALTGTPMVFVNGIQYVGALTDPKEFAQFVLTSASDAYYSTATPTPSGSPSASASPTATPVETATPTP